MLCYSMWESALIFNRCRTCLLMRNRIVPAKNNCQSVVIASLSHLIFKMTTTDSTLIPGSYNFSTTDEFLPMDFPRSLQGDFPIGDIVFFLLLNIQCMLSICGNSLTITAVLKFRRLNTPSNTFLVSLACGDICSGLLSISGTAIAAFKYAGQWDNWIHACRFQLWLSFIGPHVNIVTILAMAVDRYLSVYYPLSYRIKMNRRLATIASGAMW